jgi:uncharacterized membrane protein
MGKALGWASLGLGLPQALAPGAVNRLIGVAPTAGADVVMRGVGVQELTVGTAILGSDKPMGWLWSRVAGDVLHLAMLRSALQSGNSDEGRVRGAMAAVAGIGLLDLLAAVRLTRSDDDGPQRSVTTVTVNKPAQEVYRSWRDFQRLPEFMAHLEAVEPVGGARWRWVAHAPGGKRVTWEAELVEDRPGRRIAWRSVDGDVANAGAVSFAPAPGDRGTEVTVELTYDPPGGSVGRFAASLLGEEPRQQVRDDLRRFKQMLETGEVLRSDAIPEGTTSRRQLKQQAARPSA